ncbi:MAG TPA: hypothetical protein PKY30_21195, partial [Myxococcota bacterium]|nr:hypothetical protein [Myxococcota bacterium]
ASGYRPLAKALGRALVQVHDVGLVSNRSYLLRDAVKRLLRRLPLMCFEALLPEELDEGMGALVEESQEAMAGTGRKGRTRKVAATRVAPVEKAADLAPSRPVPVWSGPTRTLVPLNLEPGGGDSKPPPSPPSAVDPSPLWRHILLSRRHQVVELLQPATVKALLHELPPDLPTSDETDPRWKLLFGFVGSLAEFLRTMGSAGVMQTQKILGVPDLFAWLAQGRAGTWALEVHPNAGMALMFALSPRAFRRIFGTAHASDSFRRQIFRTYDGDWQTILTSLADEELEELVRRLLANPEVVAGGDGLLLGRAGNPRMVLAAWLVRKSGSTDALEAPVGVPEQVVLAMVEPAPEPVVAPPAVPAPVIPVAPPPPAPPEPTPTTGDDDFLFQEPAVWPDSPLPPPPPSIATVVRQLCLQVVQDLTNLDPSVVG